MRFNSIVSVEDFGSLGVKMCSVCACVCERERERERANVCVCVSLSLSLSPSLNVIMSVCMNEERGD